MMKSTKRSTLRRLLYIRIRTHNHGRLPTQLQHHWLQILPCTLCDLPPHHRRARKVYLPHLRRRDQRRRDLWCVLARVTNEVYGSCWEPGFEEDLGDEVVCAR